MSRRRLHNTAPRRPADRLHPTSRLPQQPGSASGKLDRHFTALWDGGHIKFWSRRTLSALLQEAGFELVAFRGAGRWPWLWKSMLIAARKPVC